VQQYACADRVFFRNVKIGIVTQALARYHWPFFKASEVSQPGKSDDFPKATKSIYPGEVHLLKGWYGLLPSTSFSIVTENATTKMRNQLRSGDSK
jgi:hypothetical protein